MAFNFSRFSIRRTFVNNSVSYQEQLDNRNVRFINQYGSPKYRYPSVEQISSLTIQKEIWAVGMRFYKLADQYYNDVEMWWLIPWFNKKPLETDFKVADIILIPTPLDRVLGLYTSLNS